MSVAVTLSVDEIMRRWPQTIRVFLDRKMRCVGCPVSCLHDLTEVCRAYALDPPVFLQALELAIGLDLAGLSPPLRPAATGDERHG